MQIGLGQRIDDGHRKAVPLQHRDALAQRLRALRERSGDEPTFAASARKTHDWHTSEAVLHPRLRQQRVADEQR
jgi:hypothetical protein